MRRIPGSGAPDIDAGGERHHAHRASRLNCIRARRIAQVCGIASNADNRRVSLVALARLVITLVVRPGAAEDGARRGSGGGDGDRDREHAPAAVVLGGRPLTRARRRSATAASAPSYTPPVAGKPTYAVIAAWDEESGEAGAATLVLIGHTEIPVETDPGAQVVALIHGRRSTARANGAGHARILAWVWPGERTATVTALDAAGNATTGNEVALELPPPRRRFSCWRRRK